MRSGLLSDLKTIGYEIFIEGDHVKLRYRKPDNPPDTVRPLIDELRKYKAEVVNILKMGSSTITSPKIVESEAIVNAIWVNPYKQGTPKARRESLLQCIDAVLFTTFDRIKAVWPQGFISTPEIRAAEIELARVQNLVLSGKAKLSDFQKAAETWERMVKQGVNNSL